jgi:UDP-GlcNAc3NAcA epimerase
MKILTIVGARPQFIKAAVVSAALRGADLVEDIVHTGQHYDAKMSDIFFQELGLPIPAHHLGIGGLSHGAMTGRMLEGLETIMLQSRPDWVLVFGDTNSTLAGALAAAKLGIPLAHVEAGMRSFNRCMPEEINRILTDHVATLHFAVSEQARSWLAQEGVSSGVEVIGDVMLDACMKFRTAATRTGARARLGLLGVRYALATVHRAENTDSSVRLAAIVSGLAKAGALLPTIVALHPRTQARLASYGISMSHRGVRVVEPLGYLDMLDLEMGASVVITDSGGVQKEAFFNGVPCVTLRDETEWVETVALGWNELASPETAPIDLAVQRALEKPSLGRPPSDVYGDGQASARIVAALLRSSAPT